MRKMVRMMGRKSRLKRQRRAGLEVRPASRKPKGRPDEEFEGQVSALAAFYSGFNEEDVLVSLCVSDLWMPNISSQVKYAFAFGVAVSMQPDRFNEGNRIETYQDFEHFTEQVHALLPNFPMLEDYVPEKDWGEIKIDMIGPPIKIFYGGILERIPDYITAFKILCGEDPSAFKHMEATLSIQDHVISSIDRTNTGSAEDIEPGHVEVPPEDFWVKCRAAVLSASVLPETSWVTDGLLKPGQLTFARTRMEFEESIWKGTALPAFLIELGTRRLPLALRNAAGAIIQHWTDERADATVLTSAVSSSLGNFLEQRLDYVVPGPFQLVARGQRLPYTFAAAVGGPKFYLFTALSAGSLEILSEIDTAVHKFISRHDDWAMQHTGDTGVVQVRRKDGTLPASTEVILVAVIASATTSNGVFTVPKTSARVLTLPDFVTIFDSIDKIEEVDRFWSFVDDNRDTIGRLSSTVDLFAAFRDSKGLLVDGAIEPNYIALDPLWGSNWRYEQLAKFWSNAPPSFPDDRVGAWKANRDSEDLYRLEGKSVPVLSWCSVINGCAVHFLFPITAELEKVDGQVLELCVQCLADSLAQRRALISDLPVFRYHRIVTVCRPHPGLLVSGPGDANAEGYPLFSVWSVAPQTDESSVRATVEVNLRLVQQRLTRPVDASFEADGACAWIDGISQALGLENDLSALEGLKSTGDRKPRFTLTEMTRRVDIPDFALPITPDLEHYKAARRDLAVVFRELGADPGQYELAAAKVLIDGARDRFRSLVHSRIAVLNRQDLVTFCVEQLDALMGRYDADSERIRLSLAHEVDYNRTTKLADARKVFFRDSRNYRYLLECCLSLPQSGLEAVTPQKVLDIIATVDWLMVLYGASDTLHNGIDVGGLRLDQSFIPTVYFSEGREEQEAAFAAELADLQLGIGVEPSDRVNPVGENSTEWRMVEDAFLQDVGVRFSDFVTGILLLSHWSSTTGSDLRWSYSVPRADIRSVMADSIEGLTTAEADRILSLATIDPAGIRRLLGKSSDEADVPIWEQNKRGNRYTIKPLVASDSDCLIWGAAAAERAAHTWWSTVTNGYLPADFAWPHVIEAARAVKASLDEQLEITAHAVVQRATPYAARGIDFMRRFPKEGFEDVGDFDVLAYWPSTNQWLVVECKNNQPAFCLKDARRLRDRIFGTEADRAQFSKIARRRGFLSSKQEHLRTLLGWPSPDAAATPRIVEVYVSRDIYWWMRNPPYDVPTHFVRVDVLDGWLRQNGLLR
ncbi:MAG: hypothetical protein ACYC5Y_00005 [Symbiobacteriia bacterium]